MERLFLSLALGLVSCGGIAESTPERGPLLLPGDDAERGQAVDLDEETEVMEEEVPPDCSGQLGQWEELFADPGWSAQALAPSSNGLEFFYARLALDPSLDSSGARLLTVRRRLTTGDQFGPPEVLEDITTACDAVRAGTGLAGLDLSVDGTRLYMACSPFRFESNSTGPLLMFEREAPGLAFDPIPSIVGELGISLGLTRDELLAYGTSLDPAIDTVQSYRRSSREESFGAPEPAPGDVSLTNPEPAPDGSGLWGVARDPEVDRSRLVFAAFNEETAAFETPQFVGPLPPEGSSHVSPALSGDCREMYLVQTDVTAKSSVVLISRR